MIDIEVNGRPSSSSTGRPSPGDAIWASAMAMTTRCCSPPDSSPKRRRASPRWSRSCRYRRPPPPRDRRTILRERHRVGVRPKPTISCTVKAKGTFNSCGTSARRRARSRRLNAPKGCPSHRTCPTCGVKMPHSSFSIVVLPGPVRSEQGRDLRPPLQVPDRSPTARDDRRSRNRPAGGQNALVRGGRALACHVHQKVYSCLVRRKR